MKKLNVLATTVITLLVASAAIQAGGPPVSPRQCARQLVADMRNCGRQGEPGAVDPSKSGKGFAATSAKDANTTQSETPGASCRATALTNYYECMGMVEVVNPGEKPEKPTVTTTEKKTAK